nr:metal ABC transporter ATP-binding protein [Deinococcus sp. JMULE3]
MSLQPGRICGLVGMNGAGKSTLFKTIMGFLPPLSGQVQVFGHAVRHAQKAGWIAYVPQAEAVDWDFPVSVRDVVTMGRQGRMGLLRRPSAADRAAVQDALDRVAMTDFAERQIGELSGGQRKRAFLARALAQDARLLLLDEPFGGVDVGTSEAITTLLSDLAGGGRSVLVSTHDLGTLETFCDDVALIADRTVLTVGPTAQVLTAPNLALTFGGRSPLHDPARIPQEVR